MGYREEYEKWLSMFSNDAETVAELNSIKDNDKEIEDRFYTELSFGTAGMRGVIGMGMNRMNVYNVRRATKGLALYLKLEGIAARGVAIAYDSRHFSDVFAKEAALTLAENGVKAYLFDALRPVPVLSYAVRHLNAAAGIEPQSSPVQRLQGLRRRRRAAGPGGGCRGDQLYPFPFLH